MYVELSLSYTGTNGCDPSGLADYSKVGDVNHRSWSFPSLHACRRFIYDFYDGIVDVLFSNMYDKGSVMVTHSPFKSLICRLERL